ncbi:helix-turn-helix transcriptional regulator [Phytohabitans flavus]|uniref:Transcriptional regulator n=1 Tax=Phytohabitans flavus TaxID=1076124 RepID=A0A6F8Y2I8_9ACTN|nr:helix-turn-helix transcriptional regulator [Phytohabitans flavus]BCB80198.1 transcriptional regulator [Phytohabitans flavus]
MILRRRLRIALRNARISLGESQKDVAEALDWSPSKLLRIEAGSSNISTVDLRSLLAHYNITSSERVEELVTMARFARRQLFNSYSDVLKTQYFTYLQYETAATVIRSFQPLLIPGPLQTREYAESILKLAHRPFDTEEVIDRRLQARMERQEVLLKDDGPELFFILDEAALSRHIGGKDVMLRQLEHLLIFDGKPEVHIQVLPFGRGEHSGLFGSFIVLEFPAPEDEPIAFLEGHLDDVILREDPEDVALYMEKFWSLEGLASPAGETSTAVLATMDRIRRS